MLSRRRWIVAGLVLALAVAGLALRSRKAEVRYQVVPATRGDVVDVVGATGTLQAVTTVQVGSQVSGTVQQLSADFNSRVTKGQVIARLDPSSFQARLGQAQANLVSARANVERQQATLDDARQKLARAEELFKAQLLPEADLETARSTALSAEAQLKANRAAVTQAVAAVNQAQVDLDHTIIRSPIDGIVVGRSVDVGQTVAASLQAPTLFTIAQDLRNMQVDTNVDEADVGRVTVGQTATFTVDSFPGRTFTGTVVQIRKAPLVVQNVVTYDVVVSARNADQRLLPGMTANVRIVIEQKEGVLQVPNAALRFRPPGTDTAEPERGARPVPGASRAGSPAAGRVWVVGPDGTPAPIPLKLGISDGTHTEVVSPELKEGQPVIVGMAAPGDRAQPGGPPRVRF
jgi:HlyD family secretion protein